MKAQVPEVAQKEPRTDAMIEELTLVKSRIGRLGGAWRRRRRKWRPTETPSRKNNPDLESCEKGEEENEADYIARNQRRRVRDGSTGPTNLLERKAGPLVVSLVKPMCFL